MRIKLDKPVQMVRLSDELLAVVGPGHSISRIDGALVVVLAEGQDEKRAQQVIDAHDPTPPTIKEQEAKRLDADPLLLALLARTAKVEGKTVEQVKAELLDEVK